jgi:lysophospholipase L1-like esterase
MKTVLCFGDSNTWGYIPGDEGGRYPYAQRVGGVLGEHLGASWRVIEEGLCGRTTVFDDPFEPDRNGKTALSMLLASHAPLDVVSIMLGTNDLKHFFGLEARDIALGAGTLVEMVQTSETGPGGSAPKVLLIAPPRVTDEAAFAPKFEGAASKSRGFGEAYQAMATQLGCGFLDAGPLCDCPVPDGVHLDDAAIAHLAVAMAEQIATL